MTRVAGRVDTVRPHDIDDMTRSEFIEYIAQLYDVPKTLIRYQETCNRQQINKSNTID